MSTHVVYCVRAADGWAPPDPMRPEAVPVAREMPAAELARNIRQDGTLPLVFDGIRVPVPLPKLAAALLALVDGERPVAAILDTLAARGLDRASVERAWRETYDALVRVNRVLLRAPP